MMYSHYQKQSNAAKSIDKEKHTTKRWIMVVIKRYHELSTAQTIQAQGIECYVPTQTIDYTWGQQETKKSIPLCPALLFVYVDAEQESQLIKEDLVLRILKDSDNNSPFVINTQVMDNFKESPTYENLKKLLEEETK